MDDLSKIINFLREVRKFQTTYRFTPKLDGGFENDAEHSWAMAMTTILLTSRLEQEFKVKLDVTKILKMIIIHDFTRFIRQVKPRDPQEILAV